jgi:hypothetical protein
MLNPRGTLNIFGKNVLNAVTGILKMISQTGSKNVFDD